jgi:SAM-dependent methyltransferase
LLQETLQKRKADEAPAEIAEDIIAGNTEAEEKGEAQACARTSTRQTSPDILRSGTFAANRSAMPPAAYTVADQLRMTRARNYFAWQSRLVTRELGRRVVEIGCGVGNFTGLLLDREMVIALDVEPACVDRLRERYGDCANLRAMVAHVNDSAFLGLVRERIDSCVCVNVLEHVEDDLQALAGMRTILVPGGVAVLIVPAFQSLFGSIDANLGHHRRYRRASLARLAERAGLRVQKAHYVNAIGFFGWWLNGHVLKRKAQSPAQIEIFDRWIVPLMSRVEAICRPPFGQSLFAVLEKP